ncbi:hypothetical protein [Schlesneria sp. T3-172]|uniref:hypothetical protein n=1 Tax=Schlesneria sphaerica TaxID=3373610 RepID=UPI0037C78904
MPASETPPIYIPAPPRKRGLQRVLSIIAIVVCCSFFACAGCCFLGLLFFGPNVVDTPAGAEEAASQIVDWTLPDQFVGKTGSTIDNALLRMDVAKFVHQEGRGVMVVGQLYFKLMPYQGQYEQLQDVLEKMIPELRKLDLTEQTTRTVVIRNSNATFYIERGEDRASTTRYRRVTGHFRGKRDRAVVILEVEEAFMTDEELEKFIDSIK